MSRNFFISLGWIFGIISFSFILGLNVKATDSIDQQNNNSSGAVNSNNVYIQTFKPEKNNFKKARVSLYTNSGDGNVVLDFYLCKGVPNNVINEYNCDGHTLLFASSTTVYLYDFPDGPSVEVDFSTSSPIQLIPGEDYFFSVSNVITDLRAVSTCSAGLYPDGYIMSDDTLVSSCGTPATDMYFKEYYQEGWLPLPDLSTDQLEDLWNYDNPYYDSPEDGIGYSNENVCYVGQACYLWVAYNSTVYGYELYILPEDYENIYDVVDPDPDPLAWSSTMHQDVLASSTPTVAGEYLYHLFVYDAPGDGADSRLYKNIPITILPADEFTQLFGTYDIDSACDDIATSTGDSFWDGVRYGIECGFRKVIYWAFTPQAETFQKLDDNKKKLEQDFPYSIYLQTKHLFTDVASSTVATSTGITLGSFIKYSPSQTALNNTKIISDGAVENAVGSTLYDQIYNGIKYLLYFLAFLYILTDVLKIKKDDENIQKVTT